MSLGTLATSKRHGADNFLISFLWVTPWSLGVQCILTGKQVPFGRTRPYRGAFQEAPGAGSDTKRVATILVSSLRAMLSCTFPKPIIKSNQIKPFNRRIRNFNSLLKRDI